MYSLDYVNIARRSSSAWSLQSEYSTRKYLARGK